MNASFKKIMAGVTVVTIVAMNMTYLTVNAAGVSVASITPSTMTASVAATYTVVFTEDTVNQLGAGSTITLAGQTFTNGTVTVNGANETITAGVITLVANPAPGVITIALLAGTNPAAGLNIVTITTDTDGAGGTIGDISSKPTAFRTVLAGANNVTVSATVAPTLSFTLSSNTIAMGTLNTDGATYVEGTVTATTATNAQGGVVVTFNSTGLADTAINKSIGTLLRGGTALTADATDAYKFAIGGVASGGTDVAATNNAVYSSAGAPVAATPVVVHVGAVAGATTEAGNYSDTLTFTVTGTF